MTPLKLTAGATAIFALLFVFAIQRIPAPAADPAKADDRFDETWELLPLKKADLERVKYSTTEPRPVATVRIAPNAPEAPPPVLVQIADKPAVQHGRRDDVCTRHRLHKVYYGRKWRCR